MISALHDPPAAEPLPKALAQLAEHVTEQTRLWQSEQRDVRAELESHFREGLDDLAEQGLPREECIKLLCEQFGDATVTARLIRRARKRGRPMLYKFVMATCVCLVIGAGTALGLAALLPGGTPTPTVDYIAKINEEVETIAPQDRMWTALAPVILEFTGLEQAARETPQPGAVGWTEAMAWVEANRHLEAALVAAVQRPHYGFIYGNDLARPFIQKLIERRGTDEPDPMAAEDDPLFPPTISVLLPHLAEVRAIALFTVLDARDHLVRGEEAAAWSSLDTGYRLGMHLFEGHTLIEQLVGAAVVALVNDEIRTVITEHGIAPALAARLESSALMTADLSVVRMQVAGERLMFLDVLQYLFTDDGDGNGELIPEQYAKLRPVLESATHHDDSGLMGDLKIITMAAQHANRKDTQAKYEELWKAMETKRDLPLYDPNRADAEQVFERMIADNRERFGVISTVLPSLQRADESMRRSRMDLEATRTTLALALAHVQHHRYPSALNGLVPNYLEAVPNDIYSGKALRYEVIEGSPVLYSFGRNLEDDGGSDAEIIVHNHTAPADIVYFDLREGE